MGENRQSRSAALVLFLAPLVYLAVTVAVVIAVCCNGAYPSGSDVMYHVYRGDWLYQSIREGNPWPLVNPMWYNGVELLRYWPPLAAYFMAFCQFLAGGSVLYGYLVFVGMICFLGALPWLYIGLRRNRPVMGAFLGLLWFFTPNNLFVLFSEGNLARALSMIFLPMLIYGIFSYLDAPRWTSLLGVTVSFMLVLLCHLGYGGMVALSVLLFLLADKIITRRKRGAIYILAALVLSFLLLGVITVPSLVGGISNVDSSETMQNFFQTIWETLNPVERLENKYRTYFGLAALAVALLGVFCARKREKAGFAAALIILLCTTTTMYPLLKLLPGSQYLWMLRFVSIALCFVLLCYLYWDTLRKPIAALLAVLLILDTVPSLSLIVGYRESLEYRQKYHITQGAEPAEERLDERHVNNMIGKAQEITDQRIALVDFSGIPNAAWHIVDWGKKTPCSNGAGWEAANTSAVISQLERAMLEGNYLYLFDRSKQLGCDTVMLLAPKIEGTGHTKDEVDSAAALAGYRFADGNQTALLYHLDVSGNWGTVSDYSAIAIGDVTVNGMCRNFPALQEGDSTNLNDYTFEELSRYACIYLANFTYDDKEKAEDLVLRLSRNGTRVVIAADGVPESRETRDVSFLGVICNSISFSNGYPELNTVDGVINTDLFPADHTEWATMYVEGLDDVWGTVEESDGTALSFCGTVKNGNIVFTGLNLPYFLSLTGDKDVEALLSRFLNLSPDDLPERRIVPLEITYGKNVITVDSPEDNVNTSLAYHGDVFDADREIRTENNLTLVDQGTTVIALRYPHLALGASVALLGLVLTVLFLFYMKKREKDPDFDVSPKERESEEETP